MLHQALRSHKLVYNLLTDRRPTLLMHSYGTMTSPNYSTLEKQVHKMLWYGPISSSVRAKAKHKCPLARAHSYNSL